MATATQLMTVDEFSQLAEDQGPEYSELRGGEIVKVPRPKLQHYLVQRSLLRLLEGETGPQYVAGTEFAFRPVPEYELRVADVALVSADLLSASDRKGYFRGSPELVVEVLSPSNTASEIYERESLCLENGGKEFWVVDTDHYQVKVSTPDARSVTYKAGQQIPLTSFGGTTIRVDDIFHF